MAKNRLPNCENNPTFPAAGSEQVRNLFPVPFEEPCLSGSGIVDGLAVIGLRMVDGAQANLIPGINRALAKRRRIKVSGRDLFGVNHECDVNESDIGPLLSLKINAFGGPTGRRHPKDAYDVLLAVSGFLDGPEAAIAAFRAEGSTGNTAFKDAIACFTNDFCEPGRDGPARGASFHPGDDAERERVRQDIVTVGRALLGM